MADRCKHCGSVSVTWNQPIPGRWVLRENSTGGRHVCAQYQKAKNRDGAFLRLYGPRKARTHAVMVQTSVPPAGTPRAMFDEINSEVRMPTYYHLTQGRK